MKNLFKILLLSIVLTSFIKADDLLASLTNGKISDNSNGVKILNEIEKSQVLGGTYEHFYQCGMNECFAIANHAKSFFDISEREKTEWMILSGGDLYMFVGFMAQNNWSVSAGGKFYNYFTYDAIVYDVRSGNIYRQPKQFLDNNLIVRQLSIVYKNQFDKHFGGLQIRNGIK